MNDPVPPRRLVPAITQDLERHRWFAARLARNLFERALEKQASRLMTRDDLSKELLMRLEEVDIPIAADA